MENYKVSDFDKIFGTNNSIRMWIKRNSDINVFETESGKCISAEDAKLTLQHFLQKYPGNKRAQEMLRGIQPEKKSRKVKNNIPRIDAMQILKGIFVTGLVFFQAKVYSALAHSCLGDIGLSQSNWFWAGVLIESAGVMIAANMKVQPDGEQYSLEEKQRVTVSHSTKKHRWAWLVTFFVFQMGIVAAKLNLFEAQGANEMLSKILVMVSIPGGIFAYSHLFINHRDYKND
jgi:hypothetical protein